MLWPVDHREAWKEIQVVLNNSTERGFRPVRVGKVPVRVADGWERPWSTRGDIQPQGGQY